MLENTGWLVTGLPASINRRLLISTRDAFTCKGLRAFPSTGATINRLAMRAIISEKCCTCKKLIS
jgi:hypothetical protein